MFPVPEVALFALFDIFCEQNFTRHLHCPVAQRRNNDGLKVLPVKCFKRHLNSVKCVKCIQVLLTETSNNMQIPSAIFALPIRREQGSHDPPLFSALLFYAPPFLLPKGSKETFHIRLKRTKSVVLLMKTCMLSPCRLGYWDIVT